MGANNGLAWATVSMQELFRDRTVEAMVISNQLALELFGGNKDKWTKVKPRVITDDEGTKHTCTHAIDVSWRWGNQHFTRDNKVYISSRLHAQTTEHEKTASRGMFHLLVPERYDSNEREPSPGGIRPVYLPPPQTQEDKDRQKKNNQAAQQSNERATEAARRKKAKEFQDIVTKAK
ncbi:hypothetical protein LTR96_002773 [Exophiala xenobiotica]|nr:hypothetical protein LTR96_002773 [Exophiala xenobiotica]KAK5558976.1 hypothetical protein LTR46_003165 [Exophiala xenobiotica]